MSLLDRLEDFTERMPVVSDCVSSCRRIELSRYRGEWVGVAFWPGAAVNLTDGVSARWPRWAVRIIIGERMLRYLYRETKHHPRMEEYLQ